MLWGECDLFIGLASGQRLASQIGRRIDHVIPEAGHGLQEDQGPMVGELIAGGCSAARALKWWRRR